jgi:Ca2+-transporting ATPase
MEHAINKRTENRPFWALLAEEIVEVLKTDIHTGLSEREAEKRFADCGPNIIEKPRGNIGFSVFLNQFKSPLILILVFAAAVTFFIGHYRDMFFILSAVIANVILGFYQEFKAEKALEELKTYLKPRTRVIRDGVEREIDAAVLVPGDVIRLSQGDRIPADGRLIFTNDFQTDEAILTGEPLPVTKSIAPVGINASLGDQLSMVFAGTLVTQGIGTAVVCRTDFFTELGKIATLVAESRREETPLQTAIRRFSVKAGVFLALLTFVVFAVGILSGYSRLEMFLTSVAIAVSAIPEGLPVAMTVILATGVQRMAKRKGVVRKLIAAETLGDVTVILTDKTGTLTMAKMELGKILPARGTERELLKMALRNTSVLVENPEDPPAEWRVSGRAVETALVRSAAEKGIPVSEAKGNVEILNTLPFNATNKFSATLSRIGEKHTLTFLGAPDVLIDHSDLNESDRRAELARIAELAGAGELVLGVASKDIANVKDFTFAKDFNFSKISFAGLITLRDPVRSSAREAVRRVGSAGIRTVIVTGDHRGTAESVAREIGMRLDGQSVIDAAELRALSDEELKEMLPRLSVISRVSPADKMHIAKAFQDAGEVVAMTGDGVNDAPSIKQADIGIAMGSGTEVARDVADLVLLDDNFETITAAIEEGRRVLNNLRKVLVYLLSSVADELILIGGSLLAGVALPLNALQILWVNFFSDSFPAVAFAFEKGADEHRRRPIKSGGALFDPLTRFLIVFIGLSTSILLFVLYWFMLKAGLPADMVKTFIFASFGTYTLFLALSVRSFSKNIFEYSPVSNPYMVLGIGAGLSLMAASIYVPFFRDIFKTVPLPPVWLAGVLGIGLLNIALIEIAKNIFHQRNNP